ncbi:MAG: homoserine kinase [Chloroherpetonaceae bacterium]|nr:homoserine kinase [Chloroherpetonaceae bacterium]
MKHQVSVFAPATVANVACGFDVFGFALNHPGDVVELSSSDSGQLEIIEITGDSGLLSRDPKINTAGVAVLALLDYLGQKRGFTMKLHKQMPLGSGLGSSAASAAAGVFAANYLLGSPLTTKELLAFAIEGERIACGAAHADNVAPALLGGFTLIRSYTPLDVIQIPVPDFLYATVIHPHIQIQTKDARSILRRMIPLSDAIVQWGNVGGVVAGFFMNDLNLISRSLQDQIVEPMRAILIPKFYEVKAAAMQAGALGCSISGSGPSLFALSSSKEVAEKVAHEMCKVFIHIQIGCDSYISSINQTGPKILSAK